MRTAFYAACTADVCLWPAAPTTAPEGLAWTGEPKYIAPWTALGGPIVTMPAGLAANGLPLGVIAAGRPGSDAEMCRWARRLAEAIGSCAFAWKHFRLPFETLEGSFGRRLE